MKRIQLIREARYSKPITWFLIVALLNLLLNMMPGGMVMAISEENRNPPINRSMDQEQMNHSPCHTDSIPQTGQDIMETVNCSDNLCEEECSFCVQIGSGIPADQVLLTITETGIFLYSGPSVLIQINYDIIPPPPKSLYS